MTDDLSTLTERERHMLFALALMAGQYLENFDTGVLDNQCMGGGRRSVQSPGRLRLDRRPRALRNLDRSRPAIAGHAAKSKGFSGMIQSLLTAKYGENGCHPRTPQILPGPGRGTMRSMVEGTRVGVFRM
ncbi:hypothetical protein LRS12_14945 [Sphingomonas sp. J344]|uniref:hypothetical protein n=1 Tax=Sphingomonas sp. J344 TaxID=2898434 RepID=UPI002150E1E6|nr:hypothetical protein [Sphingomonas sp. J344]MCR5871895.1 hypothetical protein [Sphingomonas sp. J344]